MTMTNELKQPASNITEQSKTATNFFTTPTEGITTFIDIKLELKLQN